MKVRLSNSVSLKKHHDNVVLIHVRKQSSDTPVLTNQQNHIHQLRPHSWCSFEDLACAMVNMYGWQKELLESLLLTCVDDELIKKNQTIITFLTQKSISLISDRIFIESFFPPIFYNILSFA